MKIMNIISRSGFLALIMLISTHMSSQTSQLPALNFTVGSFVSAAPDSTFKLEANIHTGDSIQVTSIRLVASDSSYTLSDQQYTISSLPTTETNGAWKEESTIHIDVPDYDPFRKKHYLLELLGSTGQLLLQLEKEF